MKRLDFDKWFCSRKRQPLWYSAAGTSETHTHRQSECSCCVCECVCESLKHPVTAVLHTFLTALTTGERQLSLQSQLKCYEVEFPLFIYLFLRAGNSQTVTVTTQI